MLAELERMGTVDDVQREAYNVPGIAGNLRFTRTDAEAYARQLIEAGLVRECEPLWDFPALWIEVAA